MHHPQRPAAPLSRGDTVLDRWWTPPDLAALWNCDRRTARDRLVEMNRAAGGRLFVADGTRLRVLGRVLEREFPGALGGEGVAVAEVRRLSARAEEHEERLVGHDEWIQDATDAIRELRGVPPASAPASHVRVRPRDARMR